MSLESLIDKETPFLLYFNQIILRLKGVKHTQFQPSENGRLIYQIGLLRNTILQQ